MNINQKILELEQRIEALENQPGSPKGAPATGTKKQKSLREFLNDQGATTANDRGLSIAYFLEIHRNYPSFNAEDIRNGFREARIQPPKNPNDLINKNIAKGLIMDAEQNKDGKRAWILTGTGEEFVNKGFRD